MQNSSRIFSSAVSKMILAISLTALIGCGQMQSTEMGDEANDVKSLDASTASEVGLQAIPRSAGADPSNWQNLTRPAASQTPGKTVEVIQAKGKCAESSPGNATAEKLKSITSAPLTHDTWMLAKAIFGESDPGWNAENFVQYFNEKLTIGSVVLNRYSMAKDWLFAVDSLGYRISVGALGFTPRNFPQSQLALQHVLLYNPASNFNAFESGAGQMGTGRLLSVFERDLAKVLDYDQSSGNQCKIANYRPDGTVADSVTSMNCECANIRLSAEIAIAMVRNYNNLARFTQDTFENLGTTLAFNTKNRHPGGKNYVAFGRHNKTAFFGIPKNRMSTTLPPRPANPPKFRVVGRARGNKLIDAAGGQEQFAPGSFVTLYGESLREGAPVTLDADANGIFPTEIPGATDEFVITANDIPVQLRYVGTGQINFILPPNLTAGEVDLVVRDNESFLTGTFNISNIAPGLYTVNQNGEGLASGFFGVIDRANEGITLSPDQPIATYSDKWNASDVPTSTASRITLVTMYGTGFAAGNPGNMTVTLQDSNGFAIQAQVRLAQQHTVYKSLCQVIFALPQNLAPGRYTVVLSGGGNSSNPVEIKVNN